MPRPALERLLDEGRERRLTVVSAPAGFGKTTALVGWCSRPEARVAWLTLDAGDNAPGRFLAHVIAALQRVEPALGARWTEGLDDGSLLDEELVLVTLANEIAELETTLTLVLDDFHEIDEPKVHDAVGFLVDHSPPQLHVVLATRTRPPIPLGRLRAQDELREIDTLALSFRREEAEALLRDELGLELAERALDLLFQKTEGWPAGLQLAGLALRQSKDPDALVASFSGQHQFVLDFLTDEVLGNQPEETQRFLLQTSILDRLRASLCRAVTLDPGTDQQLERLETENLFVVRLGDHPAELRYHQLFRDLLQRQLLRSSEDAGVEMRELHRRAWRWHVDRGESAEGLEHGIAAEDWEGVTDTLTPLARRLTQGGAYRELERILARLPDELHADPRIRVWRAATLLAHGRLASAEALLEGFESSGPAAEDPVFRSLVQGHRLVLARSRGRYEEARRLALRTLGEIPEARTATRTRIETSLAIVEVAEGDLEGAATRLERAAERVDPRHRFFAWSAAETRIAAIELQRGEMAASEARLRGILRAGLDHCRQVPVLTYVVLAETLRESDRLEEAAEQLRVAFDTDDLQGRFFLPEANLVSARLHAAQDRTEEALAQLQRALQSELPCSRFEAERVLILTRAGRLEEARAAIGTLCDAMPTEGTRDLELLALAAFSVEADEPPEAIERLTEPLLAAEARGDRLSATRMLALLAVARAAQRDTRQAHAALERALALAEAHGFRRAVLDVGGRMAHLLAGFLQDGSERNPLAGDLLARLGGSPNEARTGSAASRARLIEPLSDRELEVLNLLVAGLSNDEIADRIILSKNTVKTHLRNLYGKLGVHNRIQAIERGRGLGLLGGS